MIARCAKKICKSRWLRSQSGWVSTFHNPTVIKHNDLIVIQNCFESMRDANHCVIRESLLKHIKNDTLGLLIDAFWNPGVSLAIKKKIRRKGLTCLSLHPG